MKLILLILLGSCRLPASDGGCIAVDGDWVTAGDLASRLPVFSALNARTQVLATPGPGARRPVVAADLTRAMPGLPLDLPGDLCLERRIRVRSRTDFVEAVDQALHAQSGMIHTEITDFDRRLLPAGQLEFSLQDLRMPASTNEAVKPLLWTGRLVYSPDRSIPTWVRIKAWTEDRVCVLLHDVPTGGPIGAADCRFELRRNSPGLFPLVDAMQFTGKVAAHHLMADAPVFLSSVTAKPGVLSGQKARLRIISGPARVELEARVAGTGRIGESVMVTNPANGHHLQAKVIGEGLVEVQLQ